MFSIIFISLAAMCNAVMDKISFHYDKSIFKNFDPKWWNPEISWKNKYINGNPNIGRKKLIFNINYPVQVSDAWHLFKTAMIIYICSAIVCYQQITNLLLDLVIFGTLWNLTFSLFYNKILKTK